MISPQYSKEISQYQPSVSERTRVMKDALDTVWEFTHNSDTNRDGKINSHTMKEMWDYENDIMGPGKRDSDTSQGQSADPQMLESIKCELCGRAHHSTDCPHESQFSQMGKIHSYLIWVLTHMGGE